MRKFIGKIGHVDVNKKVGMHFEPHVRKLLVDYMNGHVGEGVEVRIRKGKATVSDSLRGYYFGAIIPFIQGIDENFRKCSDETIHSLLKHEFNGMTIMNPITSEKVTIAGHVMSNACSTQDAFIFIEKIRRWVAENYGEDLPDPDMYSRLRDRHFEKDPIARAAYPEEECDPSFN